MKYWMKVLVWLGLGGGIGFFAGYRFGYERDKKDIIDSCNEILNDKDREYRARLDDARKVQEVQEEYLGGEEEEEDPEMPDVPDMPDDPLEENDADISDGDISDDEEEEEILQFHPEDIRPFSITASEYLRNEKGYDKVNLDYYTEDGVIFDPREEERWTHPEQLLGIGWRTLFISNDDRKQIREAYIQNDTMEALYKITRIDDSFERLYEEE